MKAVRLLIAGKASRTQNYRNAFSALGAVCLTLSDELTEKQRKGPSDGGGGFLSFGLPQDPAEAFGGLILPGGGDIDPALFHADDQGSRAVEPALDRLQLLLLRAFLQKGRPVLGICKGMQLINVCLGGGIIQDLPTARNHEYIGKDQVHPTCTQKGSLLHSLYGERFPVNSAHHQGISHPGEGLSVIQRAPDGVPEAIIHRQLPLIGVQWHPERMCLSLRRPDTPDGSLLLAHFLSLVPITSAQSEIPT